MSDNLLAYDALSATQYIRTTDDAGVHTPHNIIDILPAPYELEVAAGNVSGASSLNEFGRNADLDTAGEEDIWGYGGLWVAPTAARVHALVSSSANDAAAGTGARTVEVTGLNGSYALTTETVTLDGTTPVNTVNSYVIIHKMIAKTAGSGLKNAGQITATAATDATISASIEIGHNESLMAIYQVPAGKSLYVSSYFASVNANTTAKVDLFLWVKHFGGLWQMFHMQGLDSAGAGHVNHVFLPPVKLSEKDLLRISATTSANNTDISAGFDGIIK